VSALIVGSVARILGKPRLPESTDVEVAKPSSLKSFRCGDKVSVMIQAIGYAAALLTASAFLPQVIKSWRTRSVADLSTIMLLSQGAGVTLWILYGIAIRSTPIVMSNTLTLLLVLLLALFKLRFRIHCHR
jgi:MtN3 and saliva related transmembrane protein